MIQVELIIGTNSITDQINSLKSDQSPFCLSFSLFYSSFRRGNFDQKGIRYSLKLIVYNHWQYNWLGALLFFSFS